MKRSILISVFAVAVALGTTMWPTYAQRLRAADARPEVVATNIVTGVGADARPEALATGGALLVLASVLRRNKAARAK